ncbi:hypothetical protein L3Q67_34350 [Saccharothrix sp. AJ9571]|nr:hypothetical protein L3Q67_34350 [Saccharothrix sp. AJ9571]
MAPELFDLPAASLILLLGFAAVLLAGATPRQLWAPTAAAAGASLVLSQVAHTGAATGLVLFLIGGAIGLDQALSMLRQDRRRLRKLASRPHARHLLANRQMTTTGQPVRLAGAAVIVSTATLHLAVHHVVTAVPAGSPTIPVLAVVACLPVLPAVFAKVRVAVVERVPSLRARPGTRVLSVPHDPRAGMLLSVVVLLATVFAVAAM